MKSRTVKITDWFRNQPIRTRILLSFVLMSSITGLGVSAGSLVAGYINGRQQAVDRLESALSLKRMGVENWLESLQNELLIVLNDSYNSEQIPVVLKVAQAHHYFAWYNEAVLRRLNSFVSQSSQIEKTSSSMIATTKLGTAMKATEMKASTLSARLPRCVAAKTPSGTPSSTASPIAAKVRMKV